MAVDEFDALILASTRSSGVLGRPSAKASRLESVIEACSSARQTVVVANQVTRTRIAASRGPVMGIAEGLETLGHCSPADWLIIATSQCQYAETGLPRVIAELENADARIDGVVALNEDDKPLYLVAAYRREPLLTALDREMSTKHPRLGNLVADLRLVEVAAPQRTSAALPVVPVPAVAGPVIAALAGRA